MHVRQQRLSTEWEILLPKEETDVEPRHKRRSELADNFRIVDVKSHLIGSFPGLWALF